MLSFLTDSMRLIRRDWREAGLPVIALALVVSVFAVTSVGIFNERVWEAMQSRAARSLGGDLVLQSRDPIPCVYPGVQSNGRTVR